MFKTIFFGGTHRAAPILGKVLPRGAGGNAIVRIAHRRVIDVAAIHAGIFDMP